MRHAGVVLENNYHQSFILHTHIYYDGLGKGELRISRMHGYTDIESQTVKWNEAKSSDEIDSLLKRIC